jgi:hypothetical protein
MSEKTAIPDFQIARKSSSTNSDLHRLLESLNSLRHDDLLGHTRAPRHDVITNAQELEEQEREARRRRRQEHDRQATRITPVTEQQERAYREQQARQAARPATGDAHTATGSHRFIHEMHEYYRNHARGHSPTSRSHHPDYVSV